MQDTVPHGLRVVFQPIVSAEGSDVRLVGLECLARGPAGTAMESPLVLFEHARRRGIEHLLDRAMMLCALDGLAGLAGDPPAALNVHASTLARDVGFVPFLCAQAAARGIQCSRLTVEIVEQMPARCRSGFARAMDGLREANIRVALDDVGLGHSNFGMMLDARPDFLKLDRWLVAGVESDRRRRAIVTSVADLAPRLDARLIAEGVEDPRELGALQALGIERFQGYLFARPLSARELEAHPLFLDWVGAPSGVRPKPRFPDARPDRAVTARALP
jgi:EAL domain-containing protein (putative c-di-GMP-specific phosphodiesterase class I)